jgi:two-component system sensor histidine kinase KdpD
MNAVSRTWPAAAVWALGAGAMVALDGRVDLANLAMLLVLSSAVASLWLPVAAAAASSAVAVLAFNVAFVPPRGTLDVDLRQHALLLGAMLAVNWIVAALMGALRRQARLSARHAAQVEALRAWGDTLRDAVDPPAHAGELQRTLSALAGVEVSQVALLIPTGDLPVTNDDSSMLHVGEADADRRAGLWHCLRQGHALGPGSGHHEELPDIYLPLRGRRASLGAVVLPARGQREWRLQAQALCDALGQALQRAQVQRSEQRSRELAQSQGVRNALLAAISHDFRTPLATIMGAASSLESQDARLSAEQRRRLAASIVEETQQLSRLTDNTLQLARLDAPGVTLRCDWESAEEIVGTALRHARARDATGRVRARLAPGLPLLWCDALLLSQLLDNLIDNALKYSAAPAPVELLVRVQDGQAVLAVRDRGPGVPPAWRERVFDVFQRGEGAAAERPGAGVGLAVCRAIARAHGGELRLRPRAHGGSSFECWLPLKEPPA